MVPAPTCPFTWDYWTASPSECVELTCLMPNSCYIPLIASWDATLHDVKEELWDKAARLPLYGLLHHMSMYSFQFINHLAAQEEVDDENKRLRDVKPVCGVLKLIERETEHYAENSLNTQISNLIGKDLREFELLKSSEVYDFRMKMTHLAEESAFKRSCGNLYDRLRHRYPPRIAEAPGPPKTLRLSNPNSFIVVTRVEDPETALSTNVFVNWTPNQLIESVLCKMVNSLNLRVDHPRNYVLKVCGQQEYLIADCPLIQYLYVQEKLATEGIPTVVLVNIEKLPIKNEYVNCDRPRLLSEKSNTRRKQHYACSWNINTNFTCQVISVGGLNVDTGRRVDAIIQVGIFHGGKPLCEAKKTREAEVSADGGATWNQELVFPIKVFNIPRMARLCCVIYEVTKTTRGKTRRFKNFNKEICINKIAWANTMIFDYKDQLKTETLTMYMWTFASENTQGDDLLNPLGTVVSNPYPDSSTSLVLKFSNYGYQYPILFPIEERVKEYSNELEKNTPDTIDRLSKDFEKLRITAEKDPIYEMHEQDRKDIWASREYFRESAPELLPKLLLCVEWGERVEAASVVSMLENWPMLKVESALELLDYAYADAAVRSFAVKCLLDITDDDLLLYLLQLVQAMKHESYLMCDLAIFLLNRAFRNMKIGHYLFWHMRAEMHVSSVSVRFGVVLEAYCRGCQEHIHDLKRQTDCLEKLKWLSTSIKQKKEIARARESLKDLLTEDHCAEALSDVVSPLHPSFICRKVLPSRCKVMDSKMRPLMLEFENIDPSADNVSLILKIGDDLRQDMFTLQILRIMDKLWKNEGLDFRMNLYSCISMEFEIGMIEVVTEAETIANIQKQKALFNATSTLAKESLYQWLQKHNTTDASLNKAMDEFTMSCAGYCVATYVLGIADRHSDNIMLTKSGQLFHIDFGHILGHFKEKFGFKRERVPFVLTHDFIHVITRGGQRQQGTPKEKTHFQIFRDRCETAFKILRKHGHLFLSLFSMMISTGLPEISSEKDLQYLRDTLVLDYTEEKAIEHFRNKFNDAMSNAWTASFNWACHNMDKHNKQ